MKHTQKHGVGAKAFNCVWTADRRRPLSITFGYYYYIDLARAKSEALVKIYTILKQKKK